MSLLVVVTDPGKALDDEEMLVLAAALARAGWLRLAAVVANLNPPSKRARLAKGTLTLLDSPEIPVGSGMSVVDHAVQDEAELDGVSYLAAEADIVPGAELLVQTLTAAGSQSITLLLVSAMSDAAQLVATQAELVKDRVKRVVVMGGVESDDENIVLDADGYMTPDSAVNNFYDMPAAKQLYRQLQKLGVPMTVLTRFACYAAKVRTSVYARMQETGHAVAVKIARAHHQFIDNFWLAVNASPNAAAHGGLPARWNRTLFLETFCEGKGAERTGQESIFDLVQHCTFSDPMALVAAVPELASRFYQAQSVKIGATVHQVIGVSKKHTGIKDQDALTAFLVENIMLGFTNDKQAQAAAVDVRSGGTLTAASLPATG